MGLIYRSSYGKIGYKLEAQATMTLTGEHQGDFTLTNGYWEQQDTRRKLC